MAVASAGSRRNSVLQDYHLFTIVTVRPYVLIISRKPQFGMYLPERGIHFAALAHIVGWVKRDTSAIYVGFAYLREPQKFEIASKLANPTILVADRRLNPTYDLSLLSLTALI